jgi:hypothetical protein
LRERWRTWTPRLLGGTPPPARLADDDERCDSRRGGCESEQSLYGEGYFWWRIRMQALRVKMWDTICAVNPAMIRDSYLCIVYKPKSGTGMDHVTMRLLERPCCAHAITGGPRRHLTPKAADHRSPPESPASTTYLLPPPRYLHPFCMCCQLLSRLVLAAMLYKNPKVPFGNGPACENWGTRFLS